jgi:hypothetical protein
MWNLMVFVTESHPLSFPQRSRRWRGWYVQREPAERDGPPRTLLSMEDALKGALGHDAAGEL